MNQLLAGALAGCAATAPMTMVMEALHRRLPPPERYPLPPRLVTERLAGRAGVRHEMDEPGRFGLALLAHFGMGTALGALYGPLAGVLPGPGPLKGAAFGLAAWAGNYLGLLPGVGLLSPATEHPPRRTGLMILAHLVWGATAGSLVELSAADGQRPGDRG